MTRTDTRTALIRAGVSAEARLALARLSASALMRLSDPHTDPRALQVETVEGAKAILYRDAIANIHATLNITKGD